MKMTTEHMWRSLKCWWMAYDRKNSQLAGDKREIETHPPNILWTDRLLPSDLEWQRHTYWYMLLGKYSAHAASTYGHIATTSRANERDGCTDARTSFNMPPIDICPGFFLSSLRFNKIHVRSFIILIEKKFCVRNSTISILVKLFSAQAMCGSKKL